MKKLTRIKCKKCDTILKEEDGEHHVLMSCSCGCVMVDYEEFYTRVIGDFENVEEYKEEVPDKP